MGRKNNEINMGILRIQTRKTHALFKDGLEAGFSATCHGLGFVLSYKGAKGNSLTPLPLGVK